MASPPVIARRNNAVRWKLVYFSAITVLFAVAAWRRFSMPQVPLADTDFGYFWPALMKLSGGDFPHMQGLNFLYPGMIYLILRTLGDFRAIAVVQHFLGLIAGALFLASWSGLAHFFPVSRVNRVAHEAMGLIGASIYLLTGTPLLFEMQIRADAVCMFFEMLVLWLLVQFFYHRIIAANLGRSFIYATAVTMAAFLLASLKPSFTLTSLGLVTPVIWLVFNCAGHFREKIVCLGVVVTVILAVTLTERHLRRSDPSVEVFLPRTLFAFHANIIHAQMKEDLQTGNVSSREWLQAACDDLGREMQRTHELYPRAFRRLGFEPDYLAAGGDSVLNRWQRELGKEQFMSFLSHWYWHSLAHRPLAFAQKIARQLGVFYQWKCSAFAVSPLRLAPFYSGSLAALSNPETRRLLALAPGGADFLERSKKLESTRILIPRFKVCNILFARTYLLILLITVPLATWVLLPRNASAERKWPAFFILLFYWANFGNVFGISVVHSMEVGRYSTVLFVSALFAQLWAVRWSLEFFLPSRTGRSA